MPPFNAVQGLLAAKPKGKVSKDTALYDPPEVGPFRCDNCIHFQAPEACEIVEGQIEAAGCCAMFENPRSPRVSRKSPTDDLALGYMDESEEY